MNEWWREGRYQSGAITSSAALKGPSSRREARQSRGRDCHKKEQ